MALTMQETVKGLKEIAKFGGAALSGSIAAIGAVAVTITMELKDYVDKETQKAVDDERLKEGCNHITYIDGFGPPVADMLNHLSRNEGTAWRTNPSSGLYFYHIQSDFLPKSFTDYHRKDSNGTITTYYSVPKDAPATSVCKKCQEEWDMKKARAGR